MSVRNRAPRGHPLVRRLELTSFGAMGLVGTWPRVDTVAVHLQRHFTVPKPADLLSAALPALHTIELSGDAAACDAFAAEVPRSLHLVRT